MNHQDEQFDQKPVRPTMPLCIAFVLFIVIPVIGLATTGHGQGAAVLSLWVVMAVSAGFALVYLARTIFNAFDNGFGDRRKKNRQKREPVGSQLIIALCSAFVCFLALLVYIDVITS